MTGQGIKPMATGRGALIVILILCLLLRLGLAFYKGDAEATTGAAAYKLLAQNIANGKGFISNENYSGAPEKPQPSAHGYVFYPYFLAFLMWGFDANYLTISIVVDKHPFPSSII